MPFRRSHTKSRKGCSECKRRHVKCDEGVPKCALCKKRKLDCLYPPDPDSPGSSGARDGSESGSRTSGLVLPTRMLEMRLWHQYLTSTYLTLSQDGLSGYHLSITIPQMATSHPYLLDSILALTALHLASIEVDNRQMWIEAAMRYQTQTCAAFGKIIPEITYEQYEPAFVASVFIMLYAQGFPVISAETHSDALSKVLEVRTLISGCAMLFTKLTDLGMEGELGGWLSTPDTEETLEPRAQNSGHVKIEDTKKLFDLHKNIMRSLDGLETMIESNTSTSRTLFKATWQFLHQAIQPWPKIGAHGGVIAWPLFIAEEFISLVREGDWLARILFLHYASAMRLVSNRWYVRDWGRRLVHATVQPLEEIPPMWRDTIAWMKEGIETDQATLAYISIDTN